MTKTNKGTLGETAPASRPFLVVGGCLLMVLGVLFYQSFLPGKVHFSNDGPLGAVMPLANHKFSNFLGMWQDLTWVGGPAGSISPNLTGALLVVAGAVGYSKFYAPFSLLVLGLCAWFFFRQLKLSPLACILGGLAAALNSDFFSAACWGVAGHPITFGVNYLALGLLLDNASVRGWLKAVLAGVAVGLGLTEGADIGAFFSLFVAAFAMYQAWIGEGSVVKRLAFGASRTAVVAVLAGCMAAQFINVMISTQIQGIVGTQQDAATKEMNWDKATQWSMPKIETLRVLIPGLFGYRMDTPEGGQYWGTVGRQPGWEQHQMGFPRYSGGGEYAGLLVVLVAAWALGQSFRKQGSPFSPRDRKWIWFWAVMALISLLLAFGRHAGFYRFLYALPYFSTVRNPAKFMHNFHWCVVVLFAYGLHGMAKCYLEKAVTGVGHWFQGFEKKWTLGLLGLVGVSVLGCIVFAGQSQALERYLLKNAFNATEARLIIQFSNHEAFLYLLFLILSVAALILVQRGTFAGPRTKWAGVCLGLLLVIDLGRANAPWILYHDYPARYALNPVLDFLRQRAFEHRVVSPPFRGGEALDAIQGFYRGEWLQHQFPYYGIQSLDLSQEPRVAVENQTYRLWMSTNLVRLWQLTNVRYAVGVAGGLVEALNSQLDPAQRRFRLHTPFSLRRGEGPETFVTETNAAGPFALIEFAGALPRATLYPRWQVNTNDEATLKQLASPEFDPAQTVIVANDLPAPAAATPATLTKATVEFVPDKYMPKQVVLRTKAEAPTVLLLNDKHDPDWKAWVDGQPASVLRCNYLMRGVALPAGEHTVEFRYAPPVQALYVSLAALALAAVLVGFLSATKPKAAPLANPVSPPVHKKQGE